MIDSLRRRRTPRRCRRSCSRPPPPPPCSPARALLSSLGVERDPTPERQHADLQAGVAQPAVLHVRVDRSVCVMAGHAIGAPPDRQVVGTSPAARSAAIWAAIVASTSPRSLPTVPLVGRTGRVSRRGRRRRRSPDRAARLPARPRRDSRRRRRRAASVIRAVATERCRCRLLSRSAAIVNAQSGSTISIATSLRPTLAVDVGADPDVAPEQHQGTCSERVTGAGGDHRHRRPVQVVGRAHRRRRRGG